jgi:hypothetical protein
MITGTPALLGVWHNSNNCLCCDLTIYSNFALDSYLQHSYSTCYHCLPQCFHRVGQDFCEIQSNFCFSPPPVPCKSTTNTVMSSGMWCRIVWYLCTTQYHVTSRKILILILWHIDPLLATTAKQTTRQRPFLCNSFVNAQQFCVPCYAAARAQQWKYCWKWCFLCSPLRSYINSTDRVQFS